MSKVHLSSDEVDAFGVPVVGATELVSCDHCGIVVVNPRDFGWKFWTEVTHNDEPFPLFSGEDGTTKVVRHHCPAAVQWNENLLYGLIHGTDPNDAVVYEDWPEDATVT